MSGKGLNLQKFHVGTTKGSQHFFPIFVIKNVVHD